MAQMSCSSGALINLLTHGDTLRRDTTPLPSHRSTQARMSGKNKKRSSIIIFPISMGAIQMPATAYMQGKLGRRITVLSLLVAASSTQMAISLPNRRPRGMSWSMLLLIWPSVGKVKRGSLHLTSIEGLSIMGGWSTKLASRSLLY